jgi:hypothetical protein
MENFGHYFLNYGYNSFNYGQNFKKLRVVTTITYSLKD